MREPLIPNFGEEPGELVVEYHPPYKPPILSFRRPLGAGYKDGEVFEDTAGTQYVKHGRTIHKLKKESS